MCKRIVINFKCQHTWRSWKYCNEALDSQTLGQDCAKSDEDQATTPPFTRTDQRYYIIVPWCCSDVCCRNFLKPLLEKAVAKQHNARPRYQTEVRHHCEIYCVPRFAKGCWMSNEMRESSSDPGLGRLRDVDVDVYREYLPYGGKNISFDERRRQRHAAMAAGECPDLCERSPKQQYLKIKREQFEVYNKRRMPVDDDVGLQGPGDELFPDLDTMNVPGMVQTVQSEHTKLITISKDKLPLPTIEYLALQGEEPQELVAEIQSYFAAQNGRLGKMKAQLRSTIA